LDGRGDAAAATAGCGILGVSEGGEREEGEEEGERKAEGEGRGGWCY